MMARDVPRVRKRVFGTTTRLQSFPDATLVEIQYKPRAFLPMHEHASPLFLLTVAGRFQETVAHSSRLCGPKRLIYRPAGERHSQQFLEGGATCFAIELADGFKYYDDGGELGGFPTLLAMRLYDEFLRPSNDTPLVVEEMVTVMSAAGAESCGARERAPQWLRRAVEMIEARLLTTIRLRDLAAEVDRHPVHVSRCFRRQFGCDVAEFVRRRRVHEACRRIRENSASLSAIAVAAGFSDQSHMGRAFIDIMGRSPGAYAR
jgi:AraC family transcriptional regulator